MSTTPEQQQVLEAVSGFVAQIVGDELELDEEITLETSFNNDLELESIEFVALAELLQTEYGAQIDFVGWLSGKELDEIINLTVGQLVEFILSCR